MLKKVRPLLTHPKAIALQVIILGLWLIIGRGDEANQVTLAWSSESYQVADAFLGIAIDAAMVTNGQWWEASDSPPRPLNFEEPQLVSWTTLLHPDWVRLGGTEADKLWLAQDGDAPQSIPLLQQAQLDQYLAFTTRVGAKPFITVNAGPRVRKDEQWQPDQLNRLLSWLPSNFDGALEFGNEPGAHWLIFGRKHQIRFDQLADEFTQAQQITHRRNIPLAGPANAFWPELGEPLKQVVGSSKDFLQAGAKPDFFTWHYYPTQSPRCGVKIEGAGWHELLDTEALQEFEKHSLKVHQWIARYSPNSVQWLGETGPAQCGGKAKLTDRFGASLWWISHLGVAVNSGNKVVIRQSLVGGDYALLRYNQGYSPNPDFWASVLWQQNMGSKGFRVLEAQGQIRAVAHCHTTKPGVMSMAIVNLSEHAVAISLPQAQTGQFIDITSNALDSRFVFVEGQLAETLDWQQPDNLPWVSVDQWRALPGYSYRWLNIENVSLCGDSSASPI